MSSSLRTSLSWIFGIYFCFDLHHKKGYLGLPSSSSVLVLPECFDMLQKDFSDPWSSFPDTLFRYLGDYLTEPFDLIKLDYIFKFVKHIYFVGDMTKMFASLMT